MFDEHNENDFYWHYVWQSGSCQNRTNWIEPFLLSLGLFRRKKESANNRSNSLSLAIVIRFFELFQERKSIFRLIHIIMKQFFIVKTPNGYTKVWISWAHRGAILENTDDIDANITRKSIRPDQLVYAIKEFESADIFRRRVHQYLRHLNLLIAFDITDTQTNSSVDHAW